MGSELPSSPSRSVTLHKKATGHLLLVLRWLRQCHDAAPGPGCAAHPWARASATAGLARLLAAYQPLSYHANRKPSSAATGAYLAPNIAREE